MSLAQILPSRAFSPFRFAKKKASPDPIQKLDLLARSFDESLRRRLESLAPGAKATPPPIGFSWLSVAVDALSSVHAEAQTLISGLNVSPPDDDSALARHLDESVKLLDACNLISSEIERLRQRRLRTNFALHLIGSSPAPERIRRARECLADPDEPPSRSQGLPKRSPRASIDVLIRDLAADLGRAPRGKISSAGKLARRTLYAVGLVTAFVFGVCSAALFGSEGLAPREAPAEFPWAGSFNALEAAVRAELNRRSGPGKGPVLLEIADADSRVRSLRDAMDVDAAGGARKEEDGRLEDAAKEAGVAMEAFSEGLDRLGDGVNRMFQTVLGSRNRLLGEFCKRGEATTESDGRSRSKFI